VAERVLITGLGNPESEYAGTRHNLGADTVRLLASESGLRLKRHRVGGLVADGSLTPGGPPVTLFVPSGYMNNSGGPVQRALRFYKLPVQQLVVVHDELDLQAWTVRLKRGGGPGGHNGVKDISDRCGQDFLRVRIGIGRPPGQQDPARFVLARIPATQRDDALAAVHWAAEATSDLVQLGLEAAQNIHHARSPVTG
jgi:peptidyl-tRNA hydrolase, PTH1 family